MGSLIADSGGLDVSKGARKSLQGSNSLFGGGIFDTGQMPFVRWEDRDCFGIAKCSLDLILRGRGFRSDDDGVGWLAFGQGSADKGIQIRSSEFFGLGRSDSFNSGFGGLIVSTESNGDHFFPVKTLPSFWFS